MLQRGFDPRRPFDNTSPFAHCFCFADDDADTGGGGSSAAADDAGADDDTDYKAKYLDEITSSKKYRKRAQDVEAERDALKDRALSPEAKDEFDRLKAEATEREKADADKERKRLEDEGKFDELRKSDAKTHEAAMAQKDKVHTAALAEKDDELTRTRGIVAMLGAENPLQVALSDAGVQAVGDALFYIQNSPKSEYRVVSGLDENGKPTPKVVDRQGDDVVDPDGDGKLMSVEGLVANFCASDMGERFMPASNDTGSGSHKGGPGTKGIDAVIGNADKEIAAMQELGGPEYVKRALNRKSRHPAAK